MDITLRVFVFLLSGVVFVTVVRTLLRRRMTESNSILWLAFAFVALFFGIFPSMLSQIAFALGVDYAPALLFLVSILALMLIVLRLSLQLSEMGIRLHEVSMELSMLKKECADLTVLRNNVPDLEVMR